MAPAEIAMTIGVLFGLEALVGVVFFTRALLAARNDVTLSEERPFSEGARRYLRSQLWIMRFKLASQILFLGAAIVFAIAVLTFPPQSQGSVLRAIVVPLLLIFGEGCILLVGYVLDRQRVALKRQELASTDGEGE